MDTNCFITAILGVVFGLSGLILGILNYLMRPGKDHCNTPMGYENTNALGVSSQDESTSNAKKVLSHFQGWRLSPRRFSTDPDRG